MALTDQFSLFTNKVLFFLIYIFLSQRKNNICLAPFWTEHQNVYKIKKDQTNNQILKPIKTNKLQHEQAQHSKVK